MSAAAIEPGGTPRNDRPASVVVRIEHSWGLVSALGADLTALYPQLRR
jgi:hypothetical protein